MTEIAYFRGIVHVAVSDGVLKFDSGRWQRLLANFPDAVQRSLLGTPQELLVGTTAGVYSSIDDVSWTNRSLGLSNVHIIAMTIAGDSLFASTQEQSVMRRIGDLWTAADSGLTRHPPAPPVTRVLASDGSILYAGVVAEGLFRSTNLGQSWVDVTAGLPSRDVLDVAADPGIVIVATPARLVKSNDSGSSWQTFANYPGITASAVAVKGQLILAGNSSTIYASTDGGATWQSSALPSVIKKVTIAGTRAYAVTDFDVFVRSGGSWNRAALPASQVNAITMLGSRVFVSLGAGVYLSDDGIQWSLVPGSDTLPADITALAADSRFLYAGTNGGSVFATALLAVPSRVRSVRH